MTKLEHYLDGIRAKILDEARAAMAGLEQVLDVEEFRAQMDATVENITDEYAQGFCNDASARQFGDYPYDGTDYDRSPEPTSWQDYARNHEEG